MSSTTHDHDPARPLDVGALARALRALRSMLPAGSVLTDLEDLRPYECDGLSAYRRPPMIVVLPHTLDQVRHVLALQVLTMEGELLTIGSSAPDSPGYDLLALMNGSEGLLGVIVEVTVKLLPRPDTAQVLLAAFDDVQKAGDAVAGIIASGTIPRKHLARVLDAVGIELLGTADAGAGCCGAISQHLGAPQEARRFMRRNIDAWWPQLERGAEAVVVTASANIGCIHHLRSRAEVGVVHGIELLAERLQQQRY
jgi:hypothetical protein